MSHRITTSTATLAALALSVLAPAAHAQLQLTAPPIAFGNNTFGLNFFPGTNSQVTATAAGSQVTAQFTGDMSAALIGSNIPGTYYGGTTQGAITPFSVTTLPVLINTAVAYANFKMVASGGNGVAGGNDPIVTITLHTRICQAQSNVYQPATDPFITTSEFARTYTQNGNGLQIINELSDPINVNFVLTPGNYYLYQEIAISTSYISTGVPQFTPGMTMEFGGTLTHGTYAGFNYAFGWQTVPTPSAAAALGLGGLATLRRRRKD